MFTFFIFICGLVIGGVIMFFVYHNNAKKFNKIADKAGILSDTTREELAKIGIKI